MKKTLVIILLLFLPLVSNGTLTPAEGQAIYDEVFWRIMQVFVIGLTAGLAIKFINRS